MQDLEQNDKLSASEKQELARHQQEYLTLLRKRGKELLERQGVQPPRTRKRRRSVRSSARGSA